MKHWLYKIIPRHRRILKSWRFWQFPLWALFGNDDDGIFGEEPTSGSAWINKYDMKYTSTRLDTHIDEHGIKVTHAVPGNWDHGELSFKRFLLWNLRNPLHNLFFYVLGVAWMDVVPQFNVLNFGGDKFFGVDKNRTVWPMGEYGFSFVLRAFFLPLIAVRCKITSKKRVEFYIGWRERGNFGAAFRIKTIK